MTRVAGRQVAVWWAPIRDLVVLRWYDTGYDLPVWTALVWNMGLGSPPARSAPENWTRLEELIEERSVNLALLNEAPIRDLPERSTLFSEAGTVGWDLRRDNARPKPRPWSTAVWAIDGVPREVAPRAVGSNGRRPNIPFRPSKTGSWTAGTVDAPGIGQITCVALYGLMDELSDASLHRSLSDISPVFTDPKYKKYVLVGGDLNTSTQWSRGDLRRRDRNLLERFKAYGLVDCLARMKSGRLDGCTCDLGDGCRHSWTRLDPKHLSLQVDYLFASDALASRLKQCEALPPPEWAEFSDHSPIVATFESTDG